MTKQEYIGKQATIEKRETRRMAGLLVLLACLLVVAHFVVRFNHQHPGRVASDWIPTVGFFLLWFMIIAWIVFGVRRIRRERLACPHCGKFVTRPRPASSTGHCRYCGQPLFDDALKG